MLVSTGRLACLLSASAARIAWAQTNGRAPLRLTRHQTDEQGGGDKHTSTGKRRYNGNDEGNATALRNKLRIANAL